jgi:hypothetical protein
MGKRNSFPFTGAIKVAQGQIIDFIAKYIQTMQPVTATRLFAEQPEVKKRFKTCNNLSMSLSTLWFAKKLGRIPNPNREAWGGQWAYTLPTFGGAEVCDKKLPSTIPKKKQPIGNNIPQKVLPLPDRLREDIIEIRVGGKIVTIRNAD